MTSAICTLLPPCTIEEAKQHEKDLRLIELQLLVINKIGPGVGKFERIGTRYVVTNLSDDKFSVEVGSLEPALKMELRIANPKIDSIWFHFTKPHCKAIIVATP
jgi:hypothetical protein